MNEMITSLPAVTKPEAANKFGLPWKPVDFGDNVAILYGPGEGRVLGHLHKTDGMNKYTCRIFINGVNATTEDLSHEEPLPPGLAGPWACRLEPQKELSRSSLRPRIQIVKGDTVIFTSAHIFGRGEQEQLLALGNWITDQCNRALKMIETKYASRAEQSAGEKTPIRALPPAQSAAEGAPIPG